LKPLALIPFYCNLLVVVHLLGGNYCGVFDEEGLIFSHGTTDEAGTTRRESLPRRESNEEAPDEADSRRGRLYQRGGHRREGSGGEK